MKTLNNLFDQNIKPYLLIGKGPSFDIIDKILLNKYFTIALNHAVESTQCDAVSIIDIDVVRDCPEAVYRNAKTLVIPWHPHDKNNNFQPCSKTIVDYCKEIKVLGDMLDEGRIYSYNASSAKVFNFEDNKELPNYNVFINNGDSIFTMLVANNNKKIYSIGIDGGTTYSSSFSNYKPGGNGRSFEESLAVIKKVEEQSNAELIRLGNLEEIKVFVGCSEAELVPTKVLEYSVKKNTNNPASIIPLFQCDTKHRIPRNPQCRPRTPFSFQRFFIPSLTNGKAFYFDSDMLVFKDMSELLSYEFDGYDALSCKDMNIYGHWKGSEYAVLMLDCDNIKWDINSIIDDLDSGKLTYEKLMFDFAMAKVKPVFDPSWNSLDTYEENKTSNLHYTNMNTQPWRHNGSPYMNIWFNYLKEAVDNNILSKELVVSHGQRGYIRKFK